MITFYKASRKHSKLKIIISWVMLLLILICAYIGVFHSHRYYSFDLVLWIVIIPAMSIAMLDFIWFQHGKWHKFKLLLFLVFVGGPAVALVVFLHNVYVDSLLHGHEMKTNGVVKDLYQRKYKNSRTPYAVFSYQAKGRVWTHDMINKDNSLKVGDTIKLVCSDLDPEVFVRLDN